MTEQDNLQNKEQPSSGETALINQVQTNAAVNAPANAPEKKPRKRHLFAKGFAFGMGVMLMICIMLFLVKGRTGRCGTHRQDRVHRLLSQVAFSV